MAIYMQNMDVYAFRGIARLHVPSMNHINFVLGANNCGKTSFFEVMMLFQSPAHMSHCIRVLRIREPRGDLLPSMLYRSFLSLFPVQQGKRGAIKLACNLLDKQHFLHLSGKEEMLKLSPDALTLPNVPTEYRRFSGVLQYQCAHTNEQHQTFTVSEIELFSNVPIKNNTSGIPIVYSKPCMHVFASSVACFLQDAKCKRLTLFALQQIDSGIQDIVLQKDPYTNTTSVFVEHQEKGMMPLATFGNGIQTVLQIVTAFMQAKDGILLIDEVETAIHAHHYGIYMRLIFQLASLLHVQVFMTTQNMELMDASLQVLDYGEDSPKEDIVSFITLKQIAGKTYSRILSGFEVARNRRQFGFEVRL